MSIVGGVMFELIELKIIFGVFVTSIISGIIGMGGGMILMALLSLLLPVKAAMILHGVAQASSNGFRAFIHRPNIKFKVFIPYFLGSLLLIFIFRTIEFIPNKVLIYFLLGAFPFISFIPKVAGYFSITKKFRPFLCGVLVSGAQLTAGASGGILDIFFINSPLTRYEIIATKAFTQTFGHLFKLVYFYSLIDYSRDLVILNFYIYPIVILIGFVGNLLGKLVLDKLSEKNFRMIGKGVVLSIAISLLVKGAVEFH